MLLDDGDSLMCYIVMLNNYVVGYEYVIFRITPSSCQLLVQLDINISTSFKVSLLQCTKKNMIIKKKWLHFNKVEPIFSLKIK